MPRIDVRVLGGPDVTIDGVPLPLVGRQLALAVRLAIAGHTPVSIHRLADVWPDSNGSDGAIRVALTRLRQAMGPASVTRLGHGYVLSPTAHLDADRFERLLADARDHSVPAPVRMAAVDEALGLWSGSAYEGVERSPWVEYEAIRLDELREQALDVRFELAVEHGHRDSVIAELSAAVSRTPERERRCELLALALYRTGRQAAALDVIHTTRRRLRDELGLELGSDATELEHRILVHDPALTSESGERRSATRDPRLRSATALLREGLVHDALAISGDALQGARSERDRHRIAEALLVHAQALVMSGHGDPGPLIDEAQAVARSLGDGRLLARAAIVRFGAGVPSDRTRAMIELGEPLDLLPMAAPERVELLCAAAVIVTFVDLDTAAERVLEAARRTFEAVQDPRSEAVLLATRSIVGSVNGVDATSVREMAERAASLARAIGDPTITTVALHAELLGAYATGDLDRVDDLVAELDTVAHRAVLPFGIVRVHLCRVTNAMARGELAAVPGLIDSALDVGRRMQAHSAGPAAHAQQVALELERDLLGELLEVFRVASTSSPASAYTVLAAYAGDESDLQRLHERLPAIRRDSSFRVTVALVALVAGRHDDPVAARWARPFLVEVADETMFSGFGTVCLGFGPFFLGLTERALGRLDRAEIQLQRAVELSDRAGAGLWSGHARLWLAETLLDLGGDERSSQASDLVADVAGSSISTASARVDAHLERLRARRIGVGNRASSIRP